ncbi:hypothetical protein V6N13_037556 [Hibiscus sabdariffa]
MVKFQSLGSSEIDDPKEFGILLPRLLHVSPPSRVGLGSRLFSHVFSAFGFVHKIATFEKAVGFQSLIQFTDAKTVSSARNALDGISILRCHDRKVAKESLEGHCIYDGGYCKLHLSYSSHIDLNAYSDESRDHTISYPSLLATQAPGMPVASNVCQNPQSAPLYPRTDYAASVAIQAQPSAGQIPAWDPSPQARPPYGSVLGTVPGQAYQSSVVPAYMNAVPPAGSSPHSQPGASSMGMSPPEANVRPGGAPPPGQPPYFGQ